MSIGVPFVHSHGNTGHTCHSSMSNDKMAQLAALPHSHDWCIAITGNVGLCWSHRLAIPVYTTLHSHEWCIATTGNVGLCWSHRLAIPCTLHYLEALAVMAPCAIIMAK